MQALNEAGNYIPSAAFTAWDEARFKAYKLHTRLKIAAAPIGEDPFYHAFIEGILPDELYAELKTHMLAHKRPDLMQDRLQDNPEFKNQRFNLSENQDMVVRYFRRLFSDSDVKHDLFRKFYVSPGRDLSDSVHIHEEFEYTFTAGHRFQNIHVDIPPKFLSFVFYLPLAPVPEFEELRNATVLYDEDLKPHYKARYKENSVCIFVPHFYSYHGFASTIPRDVLVMFYISPDELDRWQSIRKQERDLPPYTGLRDAIENKIRRFPLREYQDKSLDLPAVKSRCLVNAPQGRVMLDKSGQWIPMKQD